MREDDEAGMMDAAWHAFRTAGIEGCGDVEEDLRHRVETAVRKAIEHAAADGAVPRPDASGRGDGTDPASDPSLLREVRDAISYNRMHGSDWNVDLPTLFVRIERALVAGSAIPSNRAYEALDHLLSTERLRSGEPRIVDLCHSVWMTPDMLPEDRGGGRRSWLEDVRPVVVERLERMRAAILGGAASSDGSGPSRILDGIQNEPGQVSDDADRTTGISKAD